MNFEQAGLKIDKERVLTYSNIRCPFDCSYCFADDLSIERNEEVAYLSEEQVELLGKLPENVSMIMLGCDTELFLDFDDALRTIDAVSSFGKDISVVTKVPLNKSEIDKLREVVGKIEKNGNTFSISYSIPCLDSYKKWENKTPDPFDRIESLRESFAAGLNTFVAIRPLLPDISEDELEDIVSLTKDIVLGYYSGLLYVKSKEDLENMGFTEDDVEKLQPEWMPDGNMFFKFDDPKKKKILSDIICRSGKTLYDGAAEALNEIKK